VTAEEQMRDPLFVARMLAFWERDLERLSDAAAEDDDRPSQASVNDIVRQSDGERYIALTRRKGKRNK